MKLLKVSVCAFVLLASPVMASNNGNNNGNNNGPQGGNSSSSSSSSATGVGVGVGVGVGYGGSGGSVGDIRTTSRTETYIQGSASAPGLAASDCGFALSGGIVGAALGMSATTKNCMVLKEAAMLDALGRRDLALRHLVMHNDRVNKTVKGNDQTVAGTKSPKPVQASFLSCYMKDEKVHVKPKFGADVALAKDQCLQSLGF